MLRISFFCLTDLEYYCDFCCLALVVNSMILIRCSFLFFCFHKMEQVMHGCHIDLQKCLLNKRRIIDLQLCYISIGEINWPHKHLYGFSEQLFFLFMG